MSESTMDLVVYVTLISAPHENHSLWVDATDSVYCTAACHIGFGLLSDGPSVALDNHLHA